MTQAERNIKESIGKVSRLTFLWVSFVKMYLFHIMSSVAHCVEITEIYCHPFWQKFRESNVFNKDVTRT